MDVGNTTGSDAASAAARDALLVGSDERGAFIAARGSIRATLCYPLRETLLARLEESADVPAVFIDLSQCQYMDSTFVGLLVAIDRRLRAGSGGRLHIHQPSPACRELLQQMGLLELLRVEPQALDSPPPMEELEKPVGRPATEFVLQAHEALMETSEQARQKFELLREELQRKLRNEKPPEGSR
jgi:anti-anti-sigma factor